MQRVVPALRVTSFAASKLFYERLGFEVSWEHRFEPELPVFASIEFDGMEIYLTEHSGDCERGGLVHFSIPDVDAYYETIKSRGVAVRDAPSNSLGDDMRDMTIVDPDGNQLRFLTQKA
ncbi:MAG: VOC family protein [Alphaproteobacteria bacterium]|nr:VOC family protein [Alphaproteobacteria bacterium]